MKKLILATGIIFLVVVLFSGKLNIQAMNKDESSARANLFQDIKAGTTLKKTPEPEPPKKQGFFERTFEKIKSFIPGRTSTSDNADIDNDEWENSEDEEKYQKQRDLDLAIKKSQKEEELKNSQKKFKEHQAKIAEENSKNKQIKKNIDESQTPIDNQKKEPDFREFLQKRRQALEESKNDESSDEEDDTTPATQPGWFARTYNNMMGRKNPPVDLPKAEPEQQETERRAQEQAQRKKQEAEQIRIELEKQKALRKKPSRKLPTPPTRTPSPEKKSRPLPVPPTRKNPQDAPQMVESDPLVIQETRRIEEERRIARAQRLNTILQQRDLLKLTPKEIKIRNAIDALEDEFNKL